MGRHHHPVNRASVGGAPDDVSPAGSAGAIERFLPRENMAIVRINGEADKEFGAGASLSEMGRWTERRTGVTIA